MDNTLYKTAIPVEEPKTVHTPIPEETVSVGTVEEVEPSKNQELNKTPYILEVMEIPRVISKTFDIDPNTKEIDSFINEEITRLHYKDSKESYEEIYDRLSKKLKLSEFTDVYSKLDKLVSYIRIQKDMYRAIKEEEDLLAADPKDLSAAQLKKMLRILK